MLLGIRRCTKGILSGEVDGIISEFDDVIIWCVQRITVFNIHYFLCPFEVSKVWLMFESDHKLKGKKKSVLRCKVQED